MMDSSIDRSHGGGKAHHLAQLRGMGLAVPAAFVVPVSWYRDHLRQVGLEPLTLRTLLKAHAKGQANLSALGQRAAQAIRQAPLDLRLLRNMGEQFEQQGLEWPVAVRSSAVSEDSSACSFAGQFESVLHVYNWADVACAVRDVWASAWSIRCLSYAWARAAVPGEMAVIVQTQVNARWSGVLFTRDPLASAVEDSEAVVEWVAGLGDALVSGNVDPMRCRVALDAQGRVGVRADQDAAALPSEPPWLHELVTLGRRLERAWGCAQDMEWSVDLGGRLWLLQARPVTRPSFEVWSNANVCENFPAALTPFLFSIVRKGYEQYFRQLGLGFGMAPGRVNAMAACLECIVGLHGGRLYYNLSNIHNLLALAPGGRQLAAWFNTFTGAAEFPPVSILPMGPVQRVLEWGRMGFSVLRCYSRLGARVQRFERRVDDYAAHTEAAQLEPLDGARLAQKLAGFLEIRFHQWNDAALADVAAMVCYGALERSIQAARLERASGVLHDLLKGLPDLASARPVEALWQLSRMALQDPARAHHLMHTPADLLAMQWRAGALGDFGVRFHAYLRQWGFRYSRELMLDTPTPEENPAPMFELLQTYLQAGDVGPVEACATQAQSRLQATARVCEELTPVRWWRGFRVSRAGRFRCLLHWTQAAIGLRERARMKQALLYTRLRQVLLASGRVLQAQNIIAHADDIYMMDHETLLGLLRGQAPKGSLAADLARARSQHAANAQSEPPDVLELPLGSRWCASTRQQASDQPADMSLGSMILRGVSACAGTFTGPAAVVAEVSGAAAIRPGDVLVTRQTDPGWAAVFFMVKGLVIERGGMLSHGAIIAREYGIPAVIGVKHASTLIRNGQTIHIDGDHGVVELRND